MYLLPTVSQYLSIDGNGSSVDYRFTYTSICKQCNIVLIIVAIRLQQHLNSYWTEVMYQCTPETLPDPPCHADICFLYSGRLTSPKRYFLWISLPTNVLFPINAIHSWLSLWKYIIRLLLSVSSLQIQLSLTGQSLTLPYICSTFVHFLPVLSCMYGSNLSINCLTCVLSTCFHYLKLSIYCSATHELLWYLHHVTYTV